MDIMDDIKINPHIRGLQAYEAGKPIKELEREAGIRDAVKLASNENALGPPPLAVQAIKEEAARAHVYPIGDCYYLRRAMAGHLGVKGEQLIFGNGSDEIIALICHALLEPRDEVIYGAPAFVEYELISRAYGARGVAVPLRDFTHDLSTMARAVSGRTRLIFIANPNNPSGTIVGKEEFAAFMEGLPGQVTVVMDEAYFEFVEDKDYPDCLDYVRRGAPLVVMRTFSKAYALAGLRIGYGIACRGIIDCLERIRPPFNVNSLAQSAAMAALRDKEHLERSRRMVREGRAYLYRELERLGLEYIPSAANFILLKVGDGKKVFQRLLKEGVIVRAMGVYGLDEYVRVTTGTGPENERFVKALARVLGGGA